MTAIARWRIGLAILGVGLLGVGAVVLVIGVDPVNYVGILVWFLGALILHDGIAAMAVFGASVILRRVGRRIPGAILAIVQGALVIAAIVSALVIPEILKRNIGSANPTILPQEYGIHLLFFYAGLALVTAVAVVGYLAMARRQKARPSASQA